MVNIYYDDDLDENILSYVFNEMFRYISCEYQFTSNIDEAQLVYSRYKESKTAFNIFASPKFWDNLLEEKSLPQTPLYRDEEGLIYLYEKDIISSAFFLLSSYEEYLNPQRDYLGRFLYKFSYYQTDNIYSKPLVEEYRMKFITYLKKNTFSISFLNPLGNNTFSFFLTHDVDAVYKYRNTFLSLIKMVLKPSKFNLIEYIKSKINVNNDPYFNGFNILINLSNKYNFKSTYFFITKIREKKDDFYKISDTCILNIIDRIKSFSFEIALHGSIKSHKNENFLKEEINNINTNIYGIRQHYLMYDIRKTANCQSNNISYDSTLGFADNITFRSGTSLPFKMFDLEKREQINILQIPLNIMDVTLKEYMKLSPNEAFNEVKKLIDIIEKNNGIFTLLWHPGNCSDEWNEWIELFYEPVLFYLSSKKVNSLTGKEIFNLVGDYE